MIISDFRSVQALGSSHKDVRLASAQVISKIATIELPKVANVCMSEGTKQ